jgi:hypothetical protein
MVSMIHHTPGRTEGGNVERKPPLYSKSRANA